MEFQLQLLEEDLRAYQTGGDAKYHSERIKKEVRAIAECNCMSAVHTDRLKNIINRIYADQGLKWVVYEPLRRKLWNLVYRGREAIASSFYMTHKGNTIGISGIDFKKDIAIVDLPIGTRLYQWCIMVRSHGEDTLYDAATGIATVGEYFSLNKVPQEQLGINPYFDLYEAELLQAANNVNALKNDTNKQKQEAKAESFKEKGYITISKRVCCQFVLPFSVKALVSMAKGTFDDWSVQRDSYGERIEGSGLFAVGGKQQIFIPLSDFQKRQLAQIAVFV